MKKILILTVLMSLGMVLLSQDAKAQVANNSNVNTPITATLGINLPTAQTQNGTVSVGGGSPILPGGAPVPPPPPTLTIIGFLNLRVVAPAIPPIPPPVTIASLSGGVSLPTGIKVMFTGDHPIVQ